MARGDKLIKLGDSWFSAKHILVWRAGQGGQGRAAFDLRQAWVSGSDKEGPSRSLDRPGRAKVPGQEGDSPDRQLRCPKAGQ